jgi:hypothetical protein
VEFVDKYLVSIYAVDDISVSDWSSTEKAMTRGLHSARAKLQVCRE